MGKGRKINLELELGTFGKDSKRKNEKEERKKKTNKGK